MGLRNSITEHFPTIVPRGTLPVEDEQHTFRVLEASDGSDAPITTYQPQKAPFERVDALRATVDGRVRTLEEDSDYELRDTTGDGQYDTIAFIDSATYPDAGTEFFVDYVAESVITRYAGSHDEDLGTLADDIDQTIEAHYVDRASGSDLDRIGSLFGELGRRRGRTDAEYRAVLRSIVQSFNGRGTIPGLRFAVAVAVDVDVDLIEVVEDFDQVGYEVNINTGDVGNISSSLEGIIDRADPSGVKLLRPPVIVYDTIDIGIQSAGATHVDTSYGMGSGTLGGGTMLGGGSVG